MTDQRPTVNWREMQGTAASLGLGPSPDVVSWPHKLHCPQEAWLWVAAVRETWEYIGASTLKAAGLAQSDVTEINNTWLEILSQWQSALTRALASHLGHEVTGEAGGESVPEAQNEWLLVSLRFGETELPPLGVAFSPALQSLLGEPPSAAEQMKAPTARDSASPGSEPAPPSRTMDLLLELELPVSISFGKRQLPLKDVLKLTTGSIVELNRGVSEPVEILINHCLVARGEVVVVEGNYGVRIQQIASRLDRLRSIR